MEVSFALKTAIELAQNGNKSSFEFVYQETFSFVWYRASVIMNYNQEATADIVQEAYIVCYQRLSSLENIDAFYSWMSSIIYYLCMQYFRKQKREIFLEDYDSTWAESDIFSDSQINPELSAEDNATKEIVKELIKTLPEIQRLTLIAYYFDGLKIEQIAHTMDCPASTVKSRLNYARNTLKSAIETIEKTHGYRIHVISFPIMYYAFKELYLQVSVPKECTSNLFREILIRINQPSQAPDSDIDIDDLDNFNKMLSSSKYTASISAALNSAHNATASLGISAALTAVLFDASDVEILNPFNMLKADFSTLISSLKTKFALASVATAIGNNEIMLIQEVHSPFISDYAIESLLTSNLCSMYSDLLHPTTNALNFTTESPSPYSN